MEEFHLSQKLDNNISAEAFRKKTLCEVNTVLSQHYNDEDFVGQIHHIVERTLRVCTKNLSASKANQEESFEHVCNFLNCLFQDVHIKKFYNTAPVIGLEEYETVPLGKKLLSVVYGKERKLFYKEIITGGSCHHWTLILKQIFDTLEEKGLGIKTKMVFSATPGGHSLLLLQFQGKIYIADVFGINDGLNKIINPIEAFPKEIAKHFSHFPVNKKHDKDKKIFYFDDTQEFIHAVIAKPSKNISLKFKPRIQDSPVEIELSINRAGIILETNGILEKFLLPQKFSLPQNLPTTYKVLDYIFHNICGDKEKKKALQKYFVMAGEKINAQRLYEIFNYSTDEK